MLYKNIKENIKVNRCIYTLAVVLFVYGCNPTGQKRVIDWDHINYKKIACAGDNAEKKGCKSKIGSIADIGKGGKR